MPAQGQVDPHSLSSRIRLWMLENPGAHDGHHRARDVAEGLGLPEGWTRADWSQRVANVMAREAKIGRLVRDKRTFTGWSVPRHVYRLPAPGETAKGA